MALPLKPPIEPQLAKAAKELPEGDRWVYEPKWDGFRAVCFVDGPQIAIFSRTGKPLARYFPELEFPDGRYVLDGELVILDAEGREDFDALQSRLHPADSRIKLLSERMPAGYLAFDMLARGDEVLLDRPFAERRAALEQLVPRQVGSVALTPLSPDPADAEPWLMRGEGVVAKQLDAPYSRGKRRGMVKVKRVRTADAVLVGYRPGKEKGTVGSIILGLYDEGELRVVGHCSGFKAAEKRELVEKLAPYETGERGSGDPSRWASDRDLEWVSLRPELVVEVSFDHVSAGRIRHGTKLLRWRDDKDPAECGFDQLAS